MMRLVFTLTAALILTACSEAPAPEQPPAAGTAETTAAPGANPADVPLTNSPVAGVTLKEIESNGITMRIAEAGTPNGRTVLFAHGFPESWYSWRHQLKGLSALGFHVVAPDMRGYGGTDKPEDVEDYNIFELAADMVGILDALGVDQAHMVGHDWGAPVASHTVLTYPDRFKSLTLMSVPYGPRSEYPPLDAMREFAGENFQYMVYHNEPGGVAEAEYEANTRDFLSRLYLSPDSPRAEPEVTDPRRAAGGWIPRLGAPLGLPDWLTQEDLDYYVAEFEASGFRGGVNYYRTLNINWTMTGELDNFTITQPTLFIAGEQDLVISGANADDIRARMAPLVPNLEDVVLIPRIGHWVQQEAAAQTNGRMAQFLISVESALSGG